MKYRR